MKRPSFILGVISVAVLSMFCADLAYAQSPSRAQIEMFRQLPQAEQQRLMREMGLQEGQIQQSRPRASDDRRAPDTQRRDREFEPDRPELEPVVDPATGLTFYGYDLFRGARDTFAPVTDIPVPVGYVLGPGDFVNVQVLGTSPGSYSLVVNRDGAINFPELGPITVAGLSFDQAREVLQERVSQQMIGATVSMTMGELRSIRVFVLGDAERPGSYTVSGLSTITHALYASGGIRSIGSLRNIQLKRNGQLVSTLDLYDLLLRGDTRNDLRLMPGDVIFIPPVNSQVGIDGEVRRPGIYELKGVASAEDLVALAGGMTSSAYPQGASLSRISDDQDRIVQDVDLRSAGGRGLRLRDGDLLDVPTVLQRVSNSVELSGHVYRPARVQHRPGMRISDLIPSLDRLKPLADANYVLIRRELSPNRRIVAVSADLEQALRARGSEADIALQPRDKVTVFNRVPILQLEEIKDDRDDGKAASSTQRRVAPPRELFVPPPGGDATDGGVGGVGGVGTERIPAAEGRLESSLAGGVPPRQRGERWIRSGDDGWVLVPEEPEELDEAKEAERQAQFKARLDSDRQLVVERLIEELMVQASFDTHAPVVRIDGRVRAPGLYPLEPGMRVSDLLRAGGSLAESAYIVDAEVTRYEVVNGEYREAALIPIDLAGVRSGDLSTDLLLRSYDFLNVKEVTNWGEQESVTLRGEVRFPGTYPIRRGETLLSVIGRAGGLTDRAYVNGSIFTRVQLREREAQQLRDLAQRMEAELSALALEQAQAGGAQASQALATGRGLLAELNQATPVGRLAMDLRQILAAEPGGRDDVILEDGDVLMVPGPMQSVTVLGEVQSPTSILYDIALSRDDYINLSGGTTRRADSDRIYIVRANGKVTAGGSRKWFRATDVEVQPGDTIVVPTDIERMRPLPLWSAITTIIYNMAVAVAAVNSF